MKHKKKNKPSYAIYNFPYFKREQGFSGLFPLKALLAFITCWSGAIYFNYLLEIKQGGGFAVYSALVSFTVFYVLFTLFKKRQVWAFVLAAAGLIWLFFGEKVYEAAVGFWQHVMKVADGPLVSTHWYDLSKADPLGLLILIYIVFGLVCAVSSVRRFYAEPVFLFTAIMAVPAFLSLSASYHASLGVFIAGMMGQWAVNTSSAVNMYFSTGGVYNMHVADRLYKKGTAKTPKKRRLSMDMQRYGRHLSDGFIVFTVTLITIGIVSSVFPEDGAIRFDRIIDSAARFFQNIETWGTDFFGNFSAPSYEGFFSADGGNINLSGGLSPDGHHRTGIKVAEVYTENTDKLYLRGDIGYIFNGLGWESISSLNFSRIKYDRYNTESYEFEGVTPVQDVFNRYIPEIQYYTAYNSINANKPDYRTYIGIQTVKVQYLKNLNTVLFPGTPVIYNFRENNNFAVRGDFVALSNRGKINSMETGVLYLAQSPDACIINSGFCYDNMVNPYLFDGLPVSYDEYMSYLSVYDAYVQDYYTDISVAYSEVIRPFVEKAVPDADYMYYYNSLERSADIASAVLNTLNSGEYKYSLSADNFSGEDAPLYSFLYKTKTGHCAMYATAMCLALRYLGIPARYVTGFTVGGDDYVSHEEGEYKYELTDSDLHAWVEVYFEGMGWLPYDPTPSLSGPLSVVPEYTTAPETEPVTTAAEAEITTRPSETTAASTTTAESTSSVVTTAPGGTASDEPSGEPVDNSHIIKIILVILAAALAVFVVIMSVRGVLKGLDRKQRNMLEFFKSGQSDKAVKEMLGFMFKLLAIYKISRQKGETPEMFGKRVDSALEFSDVVSGAIPVFEKSEYDKAPVFTTEEQEKVYECITEMLKKTLEGMKAPKRLFTRFKLFGRRIKK